MSKSFLKAEILGRHFELPEPRFLPTTLPRGLSSCCGQSMRTKLRKMRIANLTFGLSTGAPFADSSHEPKKVSYRLILKHFSSIFVSVLRGLAQCFKYLKVLSFSIYAPINCYRRSRGIITISPEFVRRISGRRVNQASTKYLQYIGLE